MLITQTYHFAVYGAATVAANWRRARDPEVKRLCGGDVRDPIARKRGVYAASLRGA